LPYCLPLPFSRLFVTCKIGFFTQLNGYEYLTVMLSIQYFIELILQLCYYLTRYLQVY
jgi:hypothetical protein